MATTSNRNIGTAGVRRPSAWPGDDVREPAAVSVLHEILTSEQVAGLLQLHRSTVEDYARRGVLPSLKLGRHRRFVRSQIEAAISARLEWE